MDNEEASSPTRDEATRLTTAEIIAVKRLLKEEEQRDRDARDLQKVVVRYGIVAVLGVIATVFALGVKAWLEQVLLGKS